MNSTIKTKMDATRAATWDVMREIIDELKD